LHSFGRIRLIYNILTQEKNMNQTLDKLKDIILKITRLKDISPDDTLANQGISSLNMMQILQKVESEFNMEIPPEELIPENFVSLSTMRIMIDKIVRT
jgi:acyl carrier protein